MEILTHQKINPQLCGKPIELRENYCLIELSTIEDMVVDDFGLVHGGFVFGAADYAAMLAVNDPNVVLGAAEVKFIKPVKLNDTILAQAEVTDAQGKKRLVNVSCSVNNEEVFKGTLTCFVLPKHVLD